MKSRFRNGDGSSFLMSALSTLSSNTLLSNLRQGFPGIPSLHQTFNKTKPLRSLIEEALCFAKEVESINMAATASRVDSTEKYHRRSMP